MEGHLAQAAVCHKVEWALMSAVQLGCGSGVGGCEASLQQSGLGFSRTEHMLLLK